MRRLTMLAASVAVVLAGLGVGSEAATQGRWVIRDLGTLGGKWSGVSDINSRGQSVGWADTKAKDKNGYPISRAFVWQKGKMRALGTLGGKSSYASGINDRGQVVGGSATKSGDYHAFLWQNGNMRDLGTLGGKVSAANDINDRGQVVGQADTKVKDSDGYPIWHAFLWEKGTMRDLGTPGGRWSEAEAVNEQGLSVGSAATESGAEHAIVWQEGKIRDLGTLGVSSRETSEAFDVDELGQVVGCSNEESESTPPPFTSAWAILWDAAGTPRDLGALSGTRFNGWDRSCAYGTNAHGQVVGWSVNDVGRRCNAGCYHAFLWQDGKMRELRAQAGKQAVANAISDRGQIVGETFGDLDAWINGETRAVLWTYKR